MTGCLLSKSGFMFRKGVTIGDHHLFLEQKNDTFICPNAVLFPTLTEPTPICLAHTVKSLVITSCEHSIPCFLT